MSTFAKKTTVVWFRDELRVRDNALLDAAKGENVVGLFCFDPKVYGDAKKCGARRAQFTIECVADLRANLEKVGVPLYVRRGSVVEALAEMQPDRVICSQSVCSEEQSEEKSVEEVLNVKLQRVWEGTLYHKDDAMLPVDETFTSWRTRVEKKTMRKPFAEPKFSSSVEADVGAIPTLADMGYAANPVDTRGDFFDPKGGETAALARVKQYIWDEDRLKTYFDTRNGMIGQGYSSKLAPWLARGCVSARTVARECRRYEQETGTKNKSTYWLVFELTWRDYFIFYAMKWGKKLFWPSGVHGIGNPKKWSRDADKLEAWCEGRTGAPLVDANMRELKATGFMSNRGRQNAASFLIHDLGLDWRLGAAHFEAELVDYTPEANWGNWHAAAGLQGGRVNRFNILKQSKDYDPAGTYVKLWCPELALVPAPQCFEPHKLPKADRNRWNLEAYPKPVANASSSYKPSDGQQKMTRWTNKIPNGPDAKKQQVDRNKARRQRANVQNAWNDDS